MKRSHAIALGAVVVFVVAALALPRRSAIVNAPAADSKPEAHDSTAQPTEAAPVQPDPAPAPEVEPVATPVVQTVAQTPVVSQPSKKSPAKPAQKLATKTMATPVADAHSTEPADREREVATLPVPAPATPVPATPSVDQVTITGCLEASGDRFRLTDTEGSTAPKSRSWRTGFLKKRTASVDLVGAHDVAALHKQVGQRVAVSGVQVERELRMTSVRVVAPSCN